MKKNERGFNVGDPIDGRYGGTARAYVSSGATPALWLKVEVPEPNNPDGPMVDEAIILLTLKNVKRLEKQLKELRKNHFLA